MRGVQLMSLLVERTYFVSYLTPLGLVLRKGIGSQIQLNSNESNVRSFFDAGIKSLRATLPEENFYWGFCFLNLAFR
jgi:hypothetical protein